MFTRRGLASTRHHIPSKWGNRMISVYDFIIMTSFRQLHQRKLLADSKLDYLSWLKTTVMCFSQHKPTSPPSFALLGTSQCHLRLLLYSAQLLLRILPTNFWSRQHFCSSTLKGPIFRWSLSPAPSLVKDETRRCRLQAPSMTTSFHLRLVTELLLQRLSSCVSAPNNSFSSISHCHSSRLFFSLTETLSLRKG